MTRAWLRPHLRLQLDDLRVLLLHFLSQQLDLDVRAENLARITLLSERHVDIAALRPVGRQLRHSQSPTRNVKTILLSHVLG